MCVCSVLLQGQVGLSEFKASLLCLLALLLKAKAIARGLSLQIGFDPCSVYFSNFDSTEPKIISINHA